MHVVVIGAVALGTKAACRFKRLHPEAEVTMLDQSEYISYGGCGIPFYISDEISQIDALRSTPYGVLRDSKFFNKNKGIKSLTNTRATKIDRISKVVEIEDLLTGNKSTLHYDKLVLGMGSSPMRPSIPGIELEGITACTNLEEAELIKKNVSGGKINSAVVVGGGFIGLEIAVALADMWGINVSVVELGEHILPSNLGPGLAAMAAKDMFVHNVQIYSSEKVLRFEGENTRVSKVITDQREISAELVVMAAGVRPNTKLALEAGLELTDKGLIVVDEYLRTSDEHIYAGGDCAAVRNLITGKPGWFPLGSLANRQGRVIGTNLAGGKDTFSGAVGTWAIKLFSQSLAGAGLTLASALHAGYDAVSVHVEQLDRAHFYPEHALIGLDLVIDKSTRRVLGVQGIGYSGDALLARINPVAAILPYQPTIADISNLEVAYSPPFAAAIDVINTVGNAADNMLAGRLQPLDLSDFEQLWESRGQADLYVIDARLRRVSAPLAEKHPDYWHSLPTDEIRSHLAEVPKDRDIILICNTGLRSYEAQLILAEHGIKRTVSVTGGMSGVLRMGMNIAE